MSGQGFWHSVSVGVLLSGFILLPRGDAVSTVPATVGTVSCAQLTADVRSSRVDCQPVASAPVVPALAVPTPVVPALPVPVPVPVPAPVVPAPVVPAPVVPAPVVPAPVVPAPTGPSDGSADDESDDDADAETDEDSETDGSESDGSATDESDDSSGSSSSAGRSSSGGYSGTTAAATVLGAASCPATAGTTAAVAPDGDSAAGPGSPVGTATRPADVIDLAYWYLTLPTGKAGDPDTVVNPALAAFANGFFKLNDTRDGVVFSARGDGVTTKNSKYPRSELREMNGSEMAAWSNTSGTHVLDVCEAITKVPSAKPEVVAAQIHDGNDDVLQIRLEGRTLMAQYNDGGSEVVIDPNYVLGTPYNVRIVAADSKVDVFYNGVQKAELPPKGSGWYWKVGAYVQSNSSKGDGADAVGEVVVYSLKCVHA